MHFHPTHVALRNLDTLENTAEGEMSSNNGQTFIMNLLLST